MSEDAPSARYFYLRRLHSLTGVAPLGLFLLDHFFTNAYSWTPSSFNEHVKALNEIPGVQAIEWSVIIAPILFHGGLGIWMASRADWNQGQYSNYRNVMYALQRVTGVIVLLFVLFHLAQFRIMQEAAFKNTSLPEAVVPGTGGAGLYDPYGTVQRGLHANGLIVPFYVLGIVAASFHFANGIWSFCVTWGITVGRRIQHVMSWATMLIFLGVSTFGIYALLGFVFTHSHT
ncbi:succinate dehydrogenase [bacterium]|nr:succinate dehydrogenase [bacterium]